MTHVQDQEQDDADIRDEEVRGVPGNESGEAVGEDDEDVEEKPVPSEPRLPHSLVGQSVAAHIPHREGAHERDVAPVDARPADEARYGRDVQEPVEHGAAVCGEVQKGEEAECRCEGDGRVGYAALGGPSQESGSEVCVCETDEDAGAGIDV